MHFWLQFPLFFVVLSQTEDVEHARKHAARNLHLRPICLCHFKIAVTLAVVEVVFFSCLSSDKVQNTTKLMVCS